MAKNDPHDGGDHYTCKAATISRIWEKFAFLRELESEAASLRLASNETWPQNVRPWLSHHNFIVDLSDEMRNLAQLAANVPAASLREVRHKAIILNYYVERQNGPLIACLSASLVEDLTVISSEQ